MEKLIAFNIYRRNEFGGCEAAPGTSLTESNEVYLAAAAEERIAQLESAIKWALGEEGEFGEEPEPLAGKYRRQFWWRTELRRRAGL